ncbi:MAG: L-fucose:H+ symporter permease [Bacteroidetes bacterium]|nr:MAG: L-fucose:H+ symporter permease [Bacteroidota bacterium]
MQPTETIIISMEKKTSSGNKYLVPFILVAFLFFLWGMVHNLDGILIPHLKKACQLSNSQSTLIDVAIFFAYFIMAIPAGMILKKWGYKNGIIAGLILAGIGALLFLPAANSRTYELFLLALFVIGCGITILETAANPYAAILGDAKGASTRLNLGAAINGLAVFIAPLIGSAFIFSGINHSADELAAMTEPARLAYLDGESAAVKTPYIFIAAGFLFVALLFFFFKLPEVKDESKTAKLSEFIRAFRHKHLKWAVIAQFAYVGAQVCVTSFFVRMAMKYGGVDEKTAGYYLGTIYGVSFLAGRFIGTGLTRYFSSERLLTVFSVIAALLCCLAMATHGKIIIYSLGAMGFFMSIMFPTIFALGLVGLDKETKIGGSLLVMAIVGGAVLPYIMGRIIDAFNDNIQIGYIVPLICFLVIIYFAVRGYKPDLKTAE